MSIGASLIGVVKLVAFGVMEAGGNRRANLAELPHLLGSQLVEEVLTHAHDVTWRGSFKSSKPSIGQDGELPSPVGGAQLTPHPAVALQPRNRVREPTPRRKGAVGERAHAQSTVRYFGQPHQDLVVGMRHSAVALELLVEPISEQLGGLDERPPNDLLLGAKPSRLDPLGSLQWH
jgi:hypothetical protein